MPPWGDGLGAKGGDAGDDGWMDQKVQPAEMKPSPTCTGFQLLVGSGHQNASEQL